MNTDNSFGRLFKINFHSEHFVVLLLTIIIFSCTLSVTFYGKYEILTNQQNYMLDNMYRIFLNQSSHNENKDLSSSIVSAEQTTFFQSNITYRTLTVDNKGNLILGGLFYNRTTLKYDILITKLSCNGTLLWNIIWGYAEHNEYVSKVAVDFENNYIVTGILKQNSNEMVFILKIEENGNVSWSRTFLSSIPNKRELTVDDLFITIDGMITIMGNILFEEHSAIFVAQYDPLGNKYSEMLYEDSSLSVHGYGISVSNSGDIYIVGMLIHETENYTNMLLLKLNSDGDVLWRLTWGNSQSNDYAIDLVMDNEENIYVLGVTESHAKFGLQDVFLMRINKFKLVDWFKVLGGIGIDNAISLGMWHGFIVPSWYVKDENVYLSFISFDGTRKFQITSIGTFLGNCRATSINWYGSIYILFNPENNNVHTYVIKVTYDFDNDNLSSYYEAMYATNPLLNDTDHDFLNDYAEVFVYNTSPIDPDTDNDGIFDGWEVKYGLDPLNSSDGHIDIDGDGLNNIDEFKYKTDPNNVDTDGDGLSDYNEISYGSDPLLEDSDFDLIPDSIDFIPRLNNLAVVLFAFYVISFILKMRPNILLDKIGQDRATKFSRKVKSIIIISLFAYIYLVLRGVLYIPFLDVSSILLSMLEDNAIKYALIILLTLHYVLTIYGYKLIRLIAGFRASWYFIVFMASATLFLGFIIMETPLNFYVSHYLATYICAIMFALIVFITTIKRRQYIPYIVVILALNLSNLPILYLENIYLLTLLITHIYIISKYSYPEFRMKNLMEGTLVLIALAVIAIFIGSIFVTYISPLIIITIWSVIVTELNILVIILSYAIGGLISFLLYLAILWKFL
ncbi:MAG: hypothetical protein ABGF52_00485 [Candidatus Asgardarchaeum sp.]